MAQLLEGSAGGADYFPPTPAKKLSAKDQAIADLQKQSADLQDAMSKTKNKGVLARLKGAADSVQKILDASATRHAKDPVGAQEDRDQVAAMKADEVVEEPTSALASEDLVKKLSGQYSEPAATATTPTEEITSKDTGRTGKADPITGKVEVLTLTPYSAPEDPAEASENPTALDKKPGGDGTYAQDMGFKAEMNEVDDKLQKSLEDLSYKKGIIAVMQGLGMAASGWYGMHNNVDMTGIDFMKVPSFEAEEQAVLDQAKFRRKQLVDERKDSIRRGERSEDVARRAENRAEDIGIRKGERAEDTARHESTTLRQSQMETNRNAFAQARLDLDREKLDQRTTAAQSKMAGKKAEKTGLAVDIEKANTARYKAAVSPLNKLMVKSGEAEVTFDEKINAVNAYLDPIINTYPEMATELKAVRKSWMSGSEDWFDNRDVALDSMQSDIQDIISKNPNKPEPVFFTAIARQEYKEQKAIKAKAAMAMVEEYARANNLTKAQALEVLRKKQSK